MIPSSHSGVYGARSPQRQLLPRITRPVTALLPTADPAATMPSLPAMPATVVPVIAPQTPAWRERAKTLAWQAHWQAEAISNGRSPRGLEVFAVPSASLGHVTYHVLFTPDSGAVTIHDGRYVCDCRAGRRGYPCCHVGAALYTAQAEAESRESIALAKEQRMSAAWATFDGATVPDDLAWFTVGDYSALGTRYVRVLWDMRRNVQLVCECGARICTHVGVVAMRVANDRAEALRRQQADYSAPDWMNVLEPLWDGSTLPVAFV